MENNNRVVHCEDALVWLENSPVLDGCSLIASMPDISEFHGFTLAAWKDWFFQTARLVLSRTPAEGVTIFYQSDIKVDGVWVDKGFICQKAAESLGHELLWHKIVCRIQPGKCTFGRPAYSHVLCFSKGVRIHDLGNSTPDVIPETGDKTWERGMGLEVCLMIGKFITENTTTKTLVHPFCGQGAMLAVANGLGLAGIGIERSPKRAELARILTVNEEWKKFLK
ncbi:MAG: SAM-dependent methyltransferase [Bacteriovorax sp.]|nr:SAM-dependent methyltransferase [Bacteriovorax sp.]